MPLPVEKLTWGAAALIIGFVASFAGWRASVGGDLDRLRIDTEATRRDMREVQKQAADTAQALAVTIAVSDKQTQWIMLSLERLQVDRGLTPYPIPRTP
jgi:hypothetical protein